QTKVLNKAINIPDGTAPVAPTNLAGQITGNGAANLTWNNNSESDLAGYYLYYGPNQTTWTGTGAAQGNSPILVVGKNNLAITGMPAGTVYFMLKAFDTSNNLSNNSNVVQLNFSGQTTIQNLFYGNSAYTVTVSTDQGNWGYVAGTNSYTDLGKYQRFDITQSAKLTGAYFYFAGKTITGSADNFNVVVKQRNPDGSPGTTLYTQSYSTSVIDITTPGVSHNYFAISPGISFTTPFFIGIEWGASIDDRFGLIMDANAEGNAQKRAWEKWSDNTYHAMQDAWNNMDRDIWIAAEIEVASDVDDGKDIIPSGYALNQNYPNPFNPSTVISYQLPTTAFVRLRVFDILGNEVASFVNKEQHAGYYNVTFNASKLTSGIYFYRLEAGTFSETKKLMLVK
ncbi:MAG: T9SS type A sorting domain-containing protein, partial [Melioribacter sp.]|nr:T9SS type A sorting domain-containing protein [Melioribacter sp.]